MKYTVMVNGHILTQVETDGSALSAEHLLLDEIRYGIVAAQAFTPEEMKTDFFHACLRFCTFMSFEELSARSAQVAKPRLDALDRLSERIAELKEEHNRLVGLYNIKASDRGEAL